VARCSIGRASQHESLSDASNVYGLSGKAFLRLEASEETA